MDRCCSELDGQLSITYAPDRADLADIEIRVLQWRRMRHMLILWFHRVDGEWRTHSGLTSGIFAPAI